MATVTGFLTPDYDGIIAIPACTGTIATASSTGAIVLGKRRLFRIYIARVTTPSNANEKFILRFTLGNSVTGHAATTPTSSSPMITTDALDIYDIGEAYDSINLANLAADNTAITLAYSIVLLSKF